MKTSAFALAASLLVLETGAAEPSIGGEDNVRIEFVVTSVSPVGPAHRDDPASARVEFAGVSHNETGGAMFDKLAVRCVGTFERTGDRGSCVATDRDGDAILLSYRFPDETGATSVVITGGSGKFAGFRGNSQGASEAIPANPGLPLFVTRQTVRWTENAPARAVAASR